MSKIVGIYAVPDVSDTGYPSLIHDHNISILEDGIIRAYIHQERITRNKYDATLQNGLKDLVRDFNLFDSAETEIIFTDHEIGRSVLSAQGDMRFEAPLNNQLLSSVEEGRLYWYGNSRRAYVINHELAHIYSCVPFYGMFEEGSLLVHFDGGASKSNFSAWKYENNQITLIEAHYNLKWLSALFNANALVFSIVQAKMKHQNAVPGKFMGLEAYGTYNAVIEKWLFDNNFFKDCWSSRRDFFKSAKTNFGIDMNQVDNRSSFIQDISATIHEVFIREMLKEFERLQKLTGAKTLYYSGGSALNIKLNSRLIHSGIFERVCIPPCTNDSGLSIGAAAALGVYKGIDIAYSSPYLNNFKIESGYSFSENVIAAIAKLILQNKVVGVCNGAGETGPRALGNRSIIARADSRSLAKKISQTFKQREWYRPIAPIMLAKNMNFFTGEKSYPEVARYMLAEFKIRKEKKAEIEGCVHEDGTSRIQVVESREFNAFMYDLLSYLDKEYQIKALVNTSFNGKGEPIVHTTEEALGAAKKMNLDAVVLNGRLIELK